jgi:hypothetical protein
VHPFRWTEAGGIVDFGLLQGAAIGTASGVSADGSVVVGEEYLSAQHAVRWAQSDGIRDMASSRERQGLTLLHYVEGVIVDIRQKQREGK